MTYYGNRGMTLESLITYVNKRYREIGIGVIEKQHTHFMPIRNGKGEIVSCKVEEKATVDFMGRLGKTPIAIETKHTKIKNIRFDTVQDHQARFLDDFTQDNAGIGLVVISYNLNTFYAIPWAFWREAREAWIKDPKSKRTVEFDGEIWTTPGKASVTEAELLPSWEVEMGGKYGLDYLRRYI